MRAGEYLLVIIYCVLLRHTSRHARSSACGIKNNTKTVNFRRWQYVANSKAQNRGFVCSIFGNPLCIGYWSVAVIICREFSMYWLLVRFLFRLWTEYRSPLFVGCGVWLLVMCVLFYYAEASGFHGQVFVCEGGCAYFVDYFAFAV